MLYMMQWKKIMIIMNERNFFPHFFKIKMKNKFIKHWIHLNSFSSGQHGQQFIWKWKIRWWWIFFLVMAKNKIFTNSKLSNYHSLLLWYVNEWMDNRRSWKFSFSSHYYWFNDDRSWAFFMIVNFRTYTHK